jgi:hypothetical protein
MRETQWITSLLALSFYYTLANCNDLKGFDDQVLFQIEWPGNENLLVNF